MTARKTAAKKAAAKRTDPVVDRITDKLYGEKVLNSFVIDFDDITLVSEAVDELLNNANSYGQLTKATLEIDLNGGNIAIVEIEGSLPRGQVTFQERS